MPGGEELRDPAAAVVADQVDRTQVERVAELGQHAGLRGERDVLVGRDLGVAEAHQVERNAAVDVADRVDDVPPVEAVERHPVQEDRGRPPPLLDVGDAAGWRLGEAAACVKGLGVHAGVTLHGSCQGAPHAPAGLARFAS